MKPAGLGGHSRSPLSGLERIEAEGIRRQGLAAEGAGDAGPPFEFRRGVRA